MVRHHGKEGPTCISLNIEGGSLEPKLSVLMSTLSLALRSLRRSWFMGAGCRSLRLGSSSVELDWKLVSPLFGFGLGSEELAGSRTRPGILVPLFGFGLGSEELDGSLSAELDRKLASPLFGYGLGSEELDGSCSAELDRKLASPLFRYGLGSEELNGSCATELEGFGSQELVVSSSPALDKQLVSPTFVLVFGSQELDGSRVRRTKVKQLVLQNQWQFGSGELRPFRARWGIAVDAVDTIH
ncbi:hypothetical protein PM082_013324 [Marasmius tenuissimus]|nr:hypothetical protein PM082_013324 [Marasmius tenuissimus]